MSWSIGFASVTRGLRDPASSTTDQKATGEAPYSVKPYKPTLRLSKGNLQHEEVSHTGIYSKKNIMKQINGMYLVREAIPLSP